MMKQMIFSISSGQNVFQVMTKKECNFKHKTANNAWGENVHWSFFIRRFWLRRVFKLMVSLSDSRSEVIRSILDRLWSRQEATRDRLKGIGSKTPPQFQRHQKLHLTGMELFGLHKRWFIHNFYLEIRSLKNQKVPTPGHSDEKSKLGWDELI